MLPYQPGTLPHPAALAGPPVDWASLTRILVVRPDNLGDVLLLGPALRALRAASPSARLTLLASPAGAAVAPVLPEIDEVVIASPVWQDAGPAGAVDPAGTLALVEQVRAGAFDAALIFTSFSQSPYPAAFVCLLAEVPIRAALSREFGGGLLTHWQPAPEFTQHQVDRAVHLLASLGAPVDGVGGALHAEVPAAAGVGARRTVGLADGERFAVLLPGASCSSRRWEPAHFAAVARGLVERGRTVVVAGSAREAELVRDVVDRAAAAVRASEAGGVTAAGSPPRMLAAVGDLDVPALAGLLAAADVAVVNNSGGMHLADAVRTPVVALFAGTELVEEYAPRSGASRVLNRPTACTPCRAFRCPFGHECLAITPDEVLDEIAALAPGIGAVRSQAGPTGAGPSAA